jgi:hypothetical protein
MGLACSTHGGNVECTEILVARSEEKDPVDT